MQIPAAACRRALLLLSLAAVAPACGRGGSGSSGPAAPPAPNDPPVAVVTAPVGIQTGRVILGYSISDLESDVSSIGVEFSTDAGATYSAATAAPGGDGTSGLSASPGGAAHVFVWDSAVDRAGRSGPAAVRIRITPSDAAPGVAGTADFTVDNRPTAFRISSLHLRDPHVYYPFPVFGCQDATDSFPVGIPIGGYGTITTGLNGIIQAAITTDGNADGNLDLTILLIFRVFDPAGAGGKLEVTQGLCPAPPATPVCDLPSGASRPEVVASSTGGSPGLAPLPGTTSGYSPAIATPGAPAFTTASADLSFDLGVFQLPLQGVRLSATYSGVPPTSLVDGILFGFISEASAQSVMVSLGALGSVPLASLLPGGAGGCASTDDRDTGPDGITSGWWIYFNFTAQQVSYVGP